MKIKVEQRLWIHSDMNSLTLWMRNIIFRVRRPSEGGDKIGNEDSSPKAKKFSAVHPLSGPLHYSRLDFSRTEFGVEDSGETLACLWPFLKLCRLIGMCPIKRVGSDLLVPKKSHPAWLPTWLTLLILIFMVSNTCREIVMKPGTEHLVNSVNNLVYYGHGLSTCLYMIRNVKHLPGFISSCNRIEAACRIHMSPELRKDGLVQHCFLLFFSFTIAQGVGYGLSVAAVGKHFSNVNSGFRRVINDFWSLVATHKTKSTSIYSIFQAFNVDYVGAEGHISTGIFFCLAVR